ncbi:MAG: class I SAM-dependent rRNA methyltransferase [bacterium]
MHGILHLKPGKEKPVRHRHPWIFSGAIAKVEGSSQAGEMVQVRDAQGNFLAWGYYNPKSQICARLLEWDAGTAIDETWWQVKLEQAIHRRQRLLQSSETNALRLVNAEADLLPGLIVDQYGDYVVLQALTAGVEMVKATVVAHLNDLLSPKGIYERSDLYFRRIEGLPVTDGVLSGEAPPELVEIQVGGHGFWIDLRHGQKTGFFLDQNRNRREVAEYADGRNVLDCFCYTGGFGVLARAAGARSVVSLDSSAGALELLRKNFQLNSFSTKENEMVRGDVFESLRRFREDGRKYDLIILDPPKLAPTKAHVGKARRAYKDLNLGAMNLLTRDGILATFSCSSGISPALFQQIVAWASVDAGREIQILHRLSQGEDHPVRLAFPESEYLKGLVCRVL